MSEPSVEEIVAKWEAAPWDEEQREELAALIADWRKRGWALAEIAEMPHGPLPNDVSSCLNDTKWIARAALLGYPASGRAALTPQQPPPAI